MLQRTFVLLFAAVTAAVAGSHASGVDGLRASPGTRGTRMRDTSTDEVTLMDTTHRLYFVESIEYIETGPVTSTDVPAWQLSNNVGMSVKAMAEGANMVQVGWVAGPSLCTSGGCTQNTQHYSCVILVSVVRNTAYIQWLVILCIAQPSTSRSSRPPR